MKPPEVSADLLTPLLFGDGDIVVYDVYYNSDGHPKHIHDSLGGSECDTFREALIAEICKRNSTDRLEQVSSYGFAIPHKKENCEDFEITFKGVSQQICKMTIEIKSR